MAGRAIEDVIRRMTRRRALALSLGGAALLTGCASGGQNDQAAAPGETETPPEPVGAPQPPSASPLPPRLDPAPAFPVIIDTATRLTPASAETLAALGVKTVFRYYSHLPPSIPGKHLEPAERDILFGAGLDVAAVWQHFNNCHLTYANNWGREDAQKALEQASAVEQPAGSAIYFGVDGDWPYQSLLDPIIRYLEEVAEAFSGSGYDVGVYGGGCVCNIAVSRGLAKYAWLSGSTAFTGTQAFYNSGRWTLFQNQLDIRVGGSVPIDTNIANPATGGYFGQFGAEGTEAARLGAAQTQAQFGARRFIADQTELRATPGGQVIARLRQHANVLALSDDAVGWTLVQTQEGGVSARGPSRTGVVRTSQLRSLSGFAGGVSSYGLCGAEQPAPAQLATQNCARADFRRR